MGTRFGGHLPRYVPPYLWAMLAAIELADRVQVQSATGAARRRVVSGSFLSSSVDATAPSLLAQA